jgi:hypothetical protein
MLDETTIRQGKVMPDPIGKLAKVCNHNTRVFFAHKMETVMFDDEMHYIFEGGNLENATGQHMKIVMPINTEGK